jgi:hypothetical protein
MESVLGGLALVSLALHTGGMVFFAATIGPVAFSALPAEMAGRFLRAIFPVYYLFVFGTAAAAALALFPLNPVDGGLIALSAGATLWLRQVVMPRINAASDARAAGVDGAAAEFSQLHRLSVIANLFQMLLGLALLLRFIP